VTDEERRDRRISKIHGLLQKAQATTSVPEAEALTELAEKLMIQAGISAAEIDSRKPADQREQIVNIRRDMPGSWGNAHSTFFYQIMNALGTVKVIKQPRRDATTSRQLWVIGFESDVIAAYQLADSLLLQAKSALTVWERTTEGRAALAASSPAAVFSQRRSFTIAFAIRAAERVRQSRRTVLQEAPAGSALVLISRKDELAQYIAAKHPGLTSSRARYRFGAATDAGTAAGQNARTGNTEVSGRRALPSR